MKDQDMVSRARRSIYGSQKEKVIKVKLASLLKTNASTSYNIIGTCLTHYTPIILSK